jgi:putative selenate reductase FAD-binding subunit
MIREFYQPKSIEDAVLLKSKMKSATWLAGDTQLNSILSPTEPHTVISLSNVELDSITITPSAIVMGSGLALQALSENVKVPGPLRVAARQITNRNIRNIATLGGNIAANQPYSTIIPTLVAFKACLKLAGKSGMKTISLEKYIKGQSRNDLIVGVEIPRNSSTITQRVFRLTANDLPIVIVAVGVNLNKNEIIDAVVALGGINRTVVRLGRIERLITRQQNADESTIRSLIKVDKKITGQSDIRGSLDFKRHIAAVLVMKAIQEAAKG